MLLIDGSSNCGGGLARQLFASDLDVVVAPSPTDAVRQLASRRPDALVIGDKRSALTTLTLLRSAPRASDVPILAAAFDDPGSMERLSREGATDLFTRPISDAHLTYRILALVDARRARDASTRAGTDLARAQRLGGIVQWRYDAEARTFRWSHTPDGRFPGLEGEDTLERALLRWVHPDDRARVEASFATVVSRRIEYRLVLAHGEDLTVSEEADAEIDATTGRGLLVGAAQDVTELRDAERQIDRLAYYDELTSLPNRAHASRFIKQAIAGAERRGRRVAVIVLDLDRFRRINDSFGHSVGNQLLKEVAARLGKSLDDANSRGVPFVARLGGDEFVVVMSDVAPDGDPAAFFRVLADHVSVPYRAAGVEVVLSASAGLASYPADGEDAETLLMHADSAMHAAKENGRNALSVFDAEVRKRLERKLDVENRLRAALATGTSLALHYQPKVEIPSGRILGVEALLRWTAPGDPISPVELVSVAEDAGLVHVLGDWILRTACVQAKAWSESNATVVRVAVNISARQLGAADFVDGITRVLVDTGLSPDLLELEITEGVMMADAEAASRTLEHVKQLGLKIALDDFGTGFSSLAYLTRFPIDALKIDRSFVVGIGVTKKSETIITAIIALARSLDMKIVAEGVETEDQRRFLERQGPLEIQGWLFAKALPAVAAAAWIAHARSSRPTLPRAAPDCSQESRAPLRA